MKINIAGFGNVNDDFNDFNNGIKYITNIKELNISGIY